MIRAEKILGFFTSQSSSDSAALELKRHPLSTTDLGCLSFIHCSFVETGANVSTVYSSRTDGVDVRKWKVQSVVEGNMIGEENAAIMWMNWALKIVLVQNEGADGSQYTHIYVALQTSASGWSYSQQLHQEFLIKRYSKRYSKRYLATQNNKVKAVCRFISDETHASSSCMALFF